MVAFRTVHGQQLWDLDADSLQVARLPCRSSSSVCTPFSGCFLCCCGHRPSGRCGRWWLPEAWEAGSPPRSLGQQGRISRPAPIRPPQAGAGQPGAALALGIRQPTGDRDGPRPGWDISLRARAVAGQGCGRAGASRSCGVSGAPGPRMAGGRLGRGTKAEATRVLTQSVCWCGQLGCSFACFFAVVGDGEIAGV